jgi:DNA-binding beta-propeller fold protein YncE
MRRLILFSTAAVVFAAALASVSAQAPVSAPTDGGYKVVPNWPTLPPGDFFGLKTPPPPPAEREAMAAARRATGGNTPRPPGQGPTNQPGISGLAIDQHDRIYVFNRGARPVMVFNTDGKLVAYGGDQELNGRKLDPNYQHSGAVDWDGNVYMIERDAHRVVKLSPKMDKVLLQLGTTMEKGNDPTHFDLPSGVAVLRNGNIIVTDGYGNNRVVMFDKTGKFIKQVAKGAGGPGDKGKGAGEWDLPHKLAVDAQENLYIIDREGHRVQVFDRNLNYQREISVPGWNPWDIAISRKGDDGFAYIADHALERVHKLSLKDGKLVATWGKQGLGPGEFDWVHGIVVDSKGAVYAADTYGQRIQKFVTSAVAGSR